MIFIKKNKLKTAMNILEYLKTAVLLNSENIRDHAIINKRK